jgi:hypothetical protein
MFRQFLIVENIIQQKEVTINADKSKENENSMEIMFGGRVSGMVPIRG